MSPATDAAISRLTIFKSERVYGTREWMDWLGFWECNVHEQLEQLLWRCGFSFGMGFTWLVADNPVACSICLETVVGGVDCIVLPCAHLFHADCILSWFRRNDACPEWYVFHNHRFQAFRACVSGHQKALCLKFDWDIFTSPILPYCSSSVYISRYVLRSCPSHSATNTSLQIAGSSASALGTSSLHRLLNVADGQAHLHLEPLSSDSDSSSDVSYRSTASDESSSSEEESMSQDDISSDEVNAAIAGPPSSSSESEDLPHPIRNSESSEDDSSSSFEDDSSSVHPLASVASTGSSSMASHPDGGSDHDDPTSSDTEDESSSGSDDTSSDPDMSSDKQDERDESSSEQAGPSSEQNQSRSERGAPSPEPNQASSQSDESSSDPEESSSESDEVSSGSDEYESEPDDFDD